MNKRKIVFSTIMLIIIALLVCSGCTKNNSNKETDGTHSVNENMGVGIDEAAVLYTSPKGYEINYNPEKFKMKFDENAELFVINNDSGDVYLKIYFIESGDESALQTLNEKSNKQAQCSFANNTLVGTYMEVKLPDENDKGKIEKDFIFNLEDERTVIMETKMYSRTEKNAIENEWIYQMINSFKDIG